MSADPIPTPRRRFRPIQRPEAPVPPLLTVSNPPQSPGRSGANWREDGTYVVGKGCPPLHTRWRKGQSGNPRGKPKGTPNEDTVIIDLMEGMIPAKTAAGEVKMARSAALYRRIWESAAKGDLKAARFLLDRYAEARGRRVANEAAAEELSDAERTLLQGYMRVMGFGGEDGEPKGEEQ